LVAAFEDQKIEGLRQFVLDAWMEMTANSEFARDRIPPQGLFTGIPRILLTANKCEAPSVSH
jgi:hypothetical protein